MESPQPVDGKGKKGLGKFWKRFKAAFKDKETPTPSSRPVSQLPPPISTVVDATPKEYVAAELHSHETNRSRQPAVVPGTSSTKPVPTAEQIIEPSKPEDQEHTGSKAPAVPSTDMAPSMTDSDKRLERIHAVFKKYDFVFDDEGWEIPITLSESRRKVPHERVQKNIRMRVKYTCHNCKTIYGHDRICVSCSHKRCPNCVRYPPKRNKSKKTAKDAPEVAVVDPNRPAEEAQQQCACHECQTSFETGTEECPNCHHKICAICMKEAIVTIATEGAPAATTTDSTPEQYQELKPPVDKPPESMPANAISA
jgi:hypothetical protein